MQTCTKCNASTPDSLTTCSHCHADLLIFSATAVALKKYQANERIRLVRVTVAHDACPHCSGMLRTYPKSEVPILPHPGCSHENGCRCFYEPVLKETAIVGKLVE